MSVIATEPVLVSAESAAKNPGYCDTPHEDTKGYFVQQTMYRIRDPKASLDFYSRILGMTLIKRVDFPSAKFSLYFLGYVKDPATIPTDSAEKTKFLFSCKSTVELTHNWGTEFDPFFNGYVNGNSEPRCGGTVPNCAPRGAVEHRGGFPGHIGITVNDVYRAFQRFQKLEVEFVKRPDDGRMKGLAFIKDPDGYWIEILDVEHTSTVLNEQAV